MNKYFLLPLIILIFCSFSLFTQTDDIILPAPNQTGGKPLMEALKERQSAREFSSKEIPLQILSDLLWAADGINRPETGKRTAPTARNWQDLDIYVINPNGIYLYLPKENILKLIKSGDFMKETGKQEFVDDAAMNLVFVSDLSKMGNTTQEQKVMYAGIHAGAVMQNVYLYCASVGLNTVTRRYIDVENLHKIMELSPDQMIILSQTVGYKPE